MTVVGTPLPRCPRYWGLRAGHPGRGVPTVTKCARPFGQKSKSQYKRTDLLPSRSSGGGLQIFGNRKVAARIPHQSWHRLWRHHDSFPPGEAMGASRRKVLRNKKQRQAFACRCKSFCAEVVERSHSGAARTEERIAHRGFPAYLLRRVTSWTPPSTMETEETRVSLASRIRSGMLVTPTLPMVDLTLYRLFSTLSWSVPA